MSNNTPNNDDESPPNHRPFITPPLQCPCYHIKEVTQTQFPENKARIDEKEIEIVRARNAGKFLYTTEKTLLLNHFNAPIYYGLRSQGGSLLDAVLK